MNNEQWDYKINGKVNGITSIVVFLVILVFFGVLTIDQLQAQPNKSLVVAFSFGSIAVVSLCLLIRVLVRYFCFKVYIGRKGFYFKSSPFNGTYYEYPSIKRCREEVKTSHSRADTHYYYFFNFTETSGKNIKFLFEKSIWECEINVLKTRIENE